MKKYILGGIVVLFLLVGLTPLFAALSIDTFKPTDTSSFTVYDNNDTFYIEVAQDVYSAEFSVLNALVNATGYEIGFDFKIKLEDTDILNITDKIETICSGEDCYYLLINATSLSCSIDCSNNNNAVTRLGDSTWLLWSNHGDGYEINRAKTLATMWWGNAGGIDCADDSTCKSLMNSGDAVDVSAIYSPDPRDTDKRYYLSYSYTQTSSLCNLTGTFDETTGNTAITPQSIIWGTSGADQISIILNGTTIMFQSGAGTLNEMGADLTADEVDNPTTVRVYTSDGGGGGGASNKWYMVIGSNSSITWSQTGSCGTHYEQDFLGDFGIPRITNNYSWAEADFDTQIDFSTELTSLMNSCTGDPCPLYFDLTSGLWGNMTLHSLVVNITTAPTTPTAYSPLSNAIYFNDPTLTCSGSTDADGDDINYTFFSYGSLTNLGTINSTNITIYGSNCGSYCGVDFGTSYADPIDIHCQDNKERAIIFQDNLKFLAPEFIFQHEADLKSGDYCNFYIDGVSLFQCPEGDDFGATNRTIDVSSYLDGEYHTVKWRLQTDNHGNCNSAGDNAHYYVWFDQTQVDILQDSASTTYLWDDITYGVGNLWNCKACDQNDICSSNIGDQTINQMEFINCTSGNIAQQFNLLNETASQDLGVYTQDCSYGLTSAFDTRAYNFALAGLTYYNFCLSPINVSVTLNGFCQYDSTLSGYSYARQYYFDDVTLDGSNLRNYSLYQLEDALSTAITFSVTEAGVPLENRIIQIQRYDIATGNYRTVSMLKTDANGQDISYLEQTTAFYKVCVFEIGNPNPVYCSSAFHLTSDSYSIALTTSSALSWSNVVGVAHNLTFDSGSDQFELTYSDPNEKTTQFCLDVFEERFTQRVLVSSNCLSANSGTVQTSVDAINGTTYSAFAFATLFTNTSGQYVSDNFLLSQITHSYGMSEAFQNNGLFFIWLLVAIFSLLSFYSPSLSLLLAPLPIIFGSFSGIIAIPMGTALALYLGFIILAVIVGGKE